jgi:hypothetical protein
MARTTNYLSYFLSACVAGLWVPRSDIIVFLTDPPIIGLAALLTARRSGAKLVFLCQDVFPEVAILLKRFQSEAVNQLLDRINRFLIKKADRVIAIGETMRDRLVTEKGADPQKVVVIHNWADCSGIVPARKRNPFSLSHGLDEAFVVMHSGNVGLSQSLETLLDAAKVTATIFLIISGAFVFGYFLAVTRIPTVVSEYITGLNISPLGILIGVMIMYLIIGMLVDMIAALFVTLPVIFPAMMKLGFDPIWFGVLIVMQCEIALISPPFGLSLFIVKGVVKDVTMNEVIKGIFPFFIVDLIVLALYIAFPQIALFLPQQMMGK